MRACLLLILILLFAGAVFAQQSIPPSVSLQLTGVDMAQALAEVSRQSGVSILADPSVIGKVTCSLSGLSVEQVLDTLCKMNKLEWYRTYTGAAGDSLNAVKLLKIVDSLKEIGGASVICSDSGKTKQTVFIADAASVDTSALATAMKLKQVIVIRAIPAAEKATASKTGETGKTAALKDESKASKADEAKKRALLDDANAVASDAWSVLKQMPVDQQYQAVNEIRKKFYGSLSPAQKKDLKNYEKQMSKQQKQPGKHK